MSKQDMMKTLTDLKGIGEAKASALIDAGFDSVEKIQSASVDDLTKVSGISKNVATSLQDQLKVVSSPKKKSEKAPVKPEKTPEKKPVESISSQEKTSGPLKDYQPKKKPVLSDDMKQYLPLRKEIKDRTPHFYREEWFRYKRLGICWRRPDGITSKMRRNFKYRPSKVRVGFRGPKKVRGLHPSGFEEIMVFTLSDLEGINPKTQAARIGSGVGMRKRLQIQEKAKELDVRVLNEQR
jgi:large subunit ribosomal protein L32e